MRLFYSSQISNGECLLSEEESKHLAQVLRLEPGDEVVVVDGCGGWHKGSVNLAHKKKSVLTIEQSKLDFGKRSFKLNLVIAPTKNLSRFEWFLEKATEIGIDTISPIFTKNSERTVYKIDRGQKVVLSAMKQSLKAYLPSLEEPLSLSQYLDSKPDGQSFVAHCNEGDKASLLSSIGNSQNLTIFIGPEGDFTPEEVDQIKAWGAKEVTLGDQRMRTETAALASVMIANIANGNLG
ncbi:MAG: 16S rRNA (uracil1498-N3)-methyltransferase [Sphingobacteriales bacterium]|jgi:16S rRNA (uracil1498-N3)-methyltransferase